MNASFLFASSLSVVMAIVAVAPATGVTWQEVHGDSGAGAGAWSELSCEQGDGWQKCEKPPSCEYSNTAHITVQGAVGSLYEIDLWFWGASKEGRIFYAHPTLAPGPSFVHNLHTGFVKIPRGVPGSQWGKNPRIEIADVNIWSHSHNPTYVNSSPLYFKSFENLEFTIQGKKFKVGKPKYSSFNWEWQGFNSMGYEICPVS